LQKFRQWYWSKRPNLYHEQHKLRKFKRYRSRSTFRVLRKYLLIRQHLLGNDSDDDSHSQDSTSKVEEDETNESETESDDQSKEEEEMVDVDHESQKAATKLTNDHHQQQYHSLFTREKVNNNIVTNGNVRIHESMNTQGPNSQRVSVDTLLQISRRGRTIGDEGLWENISEIKKRKIEEMATKQRREDQEFKKSLRVSAWDMSLDTGKVKKLKIKKDIDPNQEKSNPFQIVADEKLLEKKQQQGFNWKN
jgi:hypothetical protein